MRNQRTRSQIVIRLGARALAATVVGLGTLCVERAGSPGGGGAVDSGHGMAAAVRSAGGPHQPVELEVVGQIGGASRDVAIEGHYAYFGVGPRLWVMDVSDPTRPVTVGYSDVLPAIIMAVDVSGLTAYVSTNLGDLWTLDISDPAEPRPLGQLVTPGWAVAVDVVGAMAFVADWEDGLQVVT